MPTINKVCLYNLFDSQVEFEEVNVQSKQIFIQHHVKI